jgi:hypothetical protein
MADHSRTPRRSRIADEGKKRYGGIDAWENEGGATEARGPAKIERSTKPSPRTEVKMTENLRIPAAILASAMLVTGSTRTHDELMGHYQEFLKRLAEHEKSGIRQSRYEGSSY